MVCLVIEKHFLKVYFVMSVKLNYEDSYSGQDKIGPQTCHPYVNAVLPDAGCGVGASWYLKGFI